MAAPPYLLRRLHKNLQRTASLVLCVTRAPRSRSSTANQVGAAYASALQRNMPVPAADAERVLEYLVGKGIHQRSELHDDRPDSWATRLRRGEGTVEAQDWFLSDPALPSSTGRESGATAAETVAVCQELQLISQRTLTLEPYGELLVVLGDEQGVSLPADESNPFSPRPAVVMAVFFQLLRCDLPFQRELASVMAPGEMTFTEELVRWAPKVFRSVLNSLPSTPGNRELAGWLEGQLESAQALAKRTFAGEKVTGRTGRRVAPQTVLRNLENSLLPRMEFLVDAGILFKPTRENYIYRTLPAHSRYTELVSDGAARIDTAFFARWAALAGVRGTPLTDDEAILEHLRPAFLKLKGLTGYAGIAESVVYANAKTLGPQWKFVELAEAIRGLRSLASAETPGVRVIADRFRQPRDFTVLG